MRDKATLPDLARLRGGYGLLLLWALFNVVVVSGPANLDSITLPFLVLPALILAISGSLIAAYLATAFFALDVVNAASQSPFSLLNVIGHVGLLILAAQALPVLRRLSSGGARLKEAGLKASAMGLTEADQARPAEPLAASNPPPSASKPGVWRRLNLALVILALILVFIGAVGQAVYILDNGNMPWGAVAISLVVSGILYTVAILLVQRVGLRRSFLIWLTPPLLLVAWFAVFSVACPACTWASR